MFAILGIVFFLTLIIGTPGGFDINFAPGLSMKNILLYPLLAAAIAAAVLQRRTANASRPPAAPSLIVFHVLCVFLIWYGLAWLGIVMINHGYVLPDRLGVSGLRMIAITFKNEVIEPYLILIVFLLAASTIEQAKALIFVILVLISAVNGVTVIDAFTGAGLFALDHGRVAGPLQSANAYGAFVNMFMPGMIAAGFCYTGLRRWFFLSNAAISFLLIILTASRGAAVGLLIGSIIAAGFLRRYVQAKRVVRFAAAALAAATLIIAVAALEYGDILYQRFIVQSEQASVSASVVTSGRSVIWESAWEGMKLHPWSFAFGYGWGAFISNNPKAAHNVYFEYLYNLGAIGLAVYLSIWIYVLRTCRRTLQYADDDARRLLIGYIFGLCIVLVSISFLNFEAAVPFVWSFTGAALCLCRLSVLEPNASVPQIDQAEGAGDASSPVKHSLSRLAQGEWTRSRVPFRS
jgi:O-antigen ligase